ncbi:MAG: hypothetical protein LC796_00020 [Acidobacteria bacterium]|nr:hypothetical protein [Acidobacteriota bacterium]MCA1612403.1 hypothetical protein [Acidobacteriota bacterium]
MSDAIPPAQEVWCRLVTSGARVLRVQIMHPDGQVVAAYAPERFDRATVGRMLAGQIRAAVRAPGTAGAVLRLTDVSGAVLFEEALVTAR